MWATASGVHLHERTAWLKAPSFFYPTNIMQPHDAASRCCAYTRQTTGVNQIFQPQNSNIGYMRERYGSSCSHKGIDIPTLINGRSTPRAYVQARDQVRQRPIVIDSLLPVSYSTPQHYNNGQSPLCSFHVFPFSRRLSCPAMHHTEILEYAQLTAADAEPTFVSQHIISQ